MASTDIMQNVQGMMVYLCSLANGLELLLGRGSESICFRAGRKIGLSWEIKNKSADLLQGIELVQQEMQRMKINWPIRAYKKAAESTFIGNQDGKMEIRLAVQNCIVRCSLARYGFPQKGSLCNTKHGLFCGLYDQVCGTKSVIEILHAGENGCLLKLKAVK